MVQVVVLQRLPFPVAEYPVRDLVRSFTEILLLPTLLERLEFVQEGVGHVDPPSLASLRWFNSATGDTASNLNELSTKVDVLPLEAD